MSARLGAIVGGLAVGAATAALGPGVVLLGALGAGGGALVGAINGERREYEARMVAQQSMQKLAHLRLHDPDAWRAWVDESERVERKASAQAQEQWHLLLAHYGGDEFTHYKARFDAQRKAWKDECDRNWHMMQWAFGIFVAALIAVGIISRVAAAPVYVQNERTCEQFERLPGGRLRPLPLIEYDDEAHQDCMLAVEVRQALNM